MAQLKDLGRIVRDKMQVIVAQNNEYAKKIAYQVLERAIDDTRVDTSKAKSNWQVSLGQSINGDIPAYVKGKKGSTADLSRAEALAIGRSIIDQKKSGEPIYIQNNIEPSEYVDKADVDIAESEAYELGLRLVAIGNHLVENK